MDVAAVLPSSLEPLLAVARNLRWTWDAETTAVFQDLSPATWETSRHDALRVMRDAPTADLDARASDAAFLARVTAAHARHTAYLASSGPFAAADADFEGPNRKHPVAYICAEFGIHESLPIYSGGLGALAGDHLKSASDMDFPLVAVGLLYRKGYMRQRLEGGTDQRALDDPFDPAQAAMDPVTDADGRPVEIALHLPGTQLAIRAWRVHVGRIPLYLLDTDVEANRPEDRSITHALYSGDAEHRLRQEIVLGAGGARLLAALGIEPSAWHVNEGHGALQALERVRQLGKDRGLTFAEAKEVVRATTVFTTHTPVPAGHDRFAEDLMRRYFSDVAEWLQIPWERFLAIGASAEDPNGFNMTKLAIEFAGVVNAVSRKHGDVSKELLRSFCPGLITAEVPVGSVTNGVHLPTWTAPRIAALVRETRAPAGEFVRGEVVRGEDFRLRAEKITDRELWKARGEARSMLLTTIAARLRRSFAERGDSERLLDKILAGLDPSALYIGFARRFATYKRADLVLRDPARLRRLLDAPGRPVRLLVAGKAHPRDSAARALLASVAALARTDEFAGRIIVVEDYDISLARTLVQGVDVWLNNPRPPLEASGTSGMKAAANGALNLSVGDGWWLEAFDGTNGWRIGTDEISPDEAKQDAADAAALMNLLEHEVVPLFFDRAANGVPKGWMERVRRSLATVPPVFDTVRMVAEYADLAYRPLARRFFELREDDYAPARALAARRARLEKGFAGLKIVAARVGGATSARPGDALIVEADVDLGSLLPGDVIVEILAGRRAGEGDLASPIRVPLAPVRLLDAAGTAPAATAAPAATVRRFEGSVVVQATGALGYGVRVRLAVDGDAPPAFDAPLLWA
jgi:starch phosphorylase